METRASSELVVVGNLVGFFDYQVLAAYRNEPEKYVIKSDFFDGRLQTTDTYYSELELAGSASEVVDIRFGYRTLRDGSLAVAAWLPDLVGYQGDRSNSHVQRWAGFQLRNPQWLDGADNRFAMWVDRYINGSFNVESGPSIQLGQTIKTINGLTNELVECSLYTDEPDETLGYPSAENTHRYEDAHRDLYGYLIDGISKKCIDLLAIRAGITVNIGDKTTLKALTSLFPSLETSQSFLSALDRVSQQRRLAAHRVRPPARSFPAFDEFTLDLSRCLAAMKELLDVLEREYEVNGEDANQRYRARGLLPQIARPAQSHFSVCRVAQMKGKTVERVEYGFRQDIEGVHGSEELLVHFTDGSIMSLATGSNAGNLAMERSDLRPEDFHVDFDVRWVPQRPVGL